MPKYIRTKDEIYEVEKLNLNKIVGNIKYEIIDNKLIKTMYGYEAHIFEYEILKQSDTIEELCDEFVMVDLLDIEMPILIFKSVVREMMRRTAKAQIYGAIWTDKGLIYVAKMDNDGKLVLI